MASLLYFLPDIFTISALHPVRNVPLAAEQLRRQDAAARRAAHRVVAQADKAVVEQLQDSFPTYYDKFPVWAQQTSAMHQLAIWTMLEDAGLGVSLQHYNPLIDETVYAEWKLDPKWELVAQMPFGTPTEGPGPKEIKPLDKRVLVFK